MSESYTMGDIDRALREIMRSVPPGLCQPMCDWTNNFCATLPLMKAEAKRDAAWEEYQKCRDSWHPKFTQAQDNRYYNQAFNLLREWFRLDHAFRRLEAHFAELAAICAALKNQDGQEVADDQPTGHDHSPRCD